MSYTTENIIKLNIGGTIFQTTTSTLTRFEGFFNTIFETDLPVRTDTDSCIFVDRSPKHFDLILNFMRDGDVPLPDDEKEILEILKEAQFYLLLGLVEYCKAKLPEENIIRVIESDADMLRIITNPVKSVLIFNFPVELGQTFYPPGFNAITFIEKYKEQFDIYFKAYKVDSLNRSVGWKWAFYPSHGSSESRRTSRPQMKTFGEAVEKSIEDNFLQNLLDSV